MKRARLVIVGGGQSGLAAARAGRDRGWEPIVLEAGPEPIGSWPDYYDSLRLFSPRQFSSFPGYDFPGPADSYPARDEVVDYVRGYASWLGVDIRTRSRVTNVTSDRAGGFTAHLADGAAVSGDVLIAASGSFGNPYIPPVAGGEEFGGQVLPVAEYRSPESFAGKRVVVVGAGNSAVQVGHELAQVAEVSLAVRDRVRLVSQLVAGRDLHWWLRLTRADLLPPWALDRFVTGTPVIDAGRYQQALHCGQLDQRRMFTAFTRDGVVWPDGTPERVDAVIFATGYRPHLPYLGSLGALDTDGAPRHRHGISTSAPGLGFLGLEFQRTFSSNTLRGVHRDAGFVVGALAHQRRKVAVG
ncbi:flavin-containing monooxygenase [Ruania zhangjianzhongii]|uniref:flavin-containing monooxygenase n=1 Tax=Ruania zhangjianzhongii TaxID=2603206 RepID=UPI0011C9AB5C|nr:NAD(P)/FAD-dependent oxidoreductase [Ruania zhangjianzhongii]